MKGRRKKAYVPDPRIVKNQLMMNKLTAEADLVLDPKQSRSKKQPAVELTPEMAARANDLRRKVMEGHGKKKWQKKLKARWVRRKKLGFPPSSADRKFC